MGRLCEERMYHPLSIIFKDVVGRTNEFTAKWENYRPKSQKHKNHNCVLLDKLD